MCPNFSESFHRLTTVPPFPWQQRLYERFARGEVPPLADIPTGLGKTSAVTVWLIALIEHPDKVPRRLVYVVNRRTVVDQTTDEVKRLRERLREMPDLLGKLNDRCAVPVEMPLALSTLRGQFADNREWCADPARPAVIVGTVDMIGSGLLFNRYTCGFKARPHHAGLLGQDVLLVHDEAHLEPAFQKLLDSIMAEQKRCGESRPLRVMQLSATGRNGADADSASKVLRLTAEDETNETVRRRINAAKQLRLNAIPDEKQLAEKLSELALARRDSGRAVLVFARPVEVVQKIESALGKAKQSVVVLTGTMRGKERDDLVNDARFLRFLPLSSRAKSAPEPLTGTVYLVATSAGEVGVNLSADELICDLSTFESMAQRFGRVNRFGEVESSTIDVVHPEAFKEDDMEQARFCTLDLFRQLHGSASPHALGHALSQLDATARSAAFSPPPKIRPATDIIFDSWAMTSVRGPLPGRPPVAPYLHGESEWEPPETYVAWRSEVEIITDALAATYPPRELIADFPLKPHELLRDRSDRVQTELEKLADAAVDNAEKIVWLVDEDGKVASKQLKELLGKDSQALHGATVLLPPSIGGLSERGLLDGNSLGNIDLDVADILHGPDGQALRRRVFHSNPKVPAKHRGLRIVRIIDTLLGEEDLDENPEGELDNRYWLWLEAPKSSGAESLRSADESISLCDHSRDVEGHACAIVEKLTLAEPLARCVILAARFHDLGKRRLYWQRGIGNMDANRWLAKAGPELTPRLPTEPYRHEFGSLLDAEREAEFSKLPPDEQDLVLHLIAAHHGRARPHFPTDESFDPDAALGDSQRITAEVPRRFARLQRHFGRWGLAYLESLLRAADYAASAGIKPLSKPTS
ncbi:MAG TPA: type I-U CRISPR-associated helicase/endonuclease Cas3 [Verrucomicrobiota bacterium]|nr:type I-U CRISPR-associated helicase/endonuclease Cas3 [Verrucomicrobiales bacterium]HRI13979.1 type I-U CRISPR-associated helicase/endonuclease Cas3 [Verrucomicrobiota bacterium]